jgi:hypothetical protein
MEFRSQTWLKRQNTEKIAKKTTHIIPTAADWRFYRLMNSEKQTLEEPLMYSLLPERQATSHGAIFSYFYCLCGWSRNRDDTEDQYRPGCFFSDYKLKQVIRESKTSCQKTIFPISIFRPSMVVATQKQAQ